MNRDFVKALNAKDAIAASNCYTEDATIPPPDGDLGCEIGRLQMKMKMPNGKIVVERDKYKEILKLDPDGKWKSTLGMWSTGTLALQ